MTDTMAALAAIPSPSAGAEPLLERSSLHGLSSDRDLNLAHAKESARVAPTSGMAHATLGHAQLALQQYPSAVQSFKKAIALGLDDRATHDALKQARIGVLDALGTADAAECPRPPPVVATPPPPAQPSPARAGALAPGNSMAYEVGWQCLRLFGQHLLRQSTPLQLGLPLLCLGVASWLVHNWCVALLAVFLGYIALWFHYKVRWRRLHWRFWVRLPWLAYALPLLLRLLGQYKLFVLVHTAWPVACTVAMTCALTTSPRVRMCLLHGSVFLYYVVWERNTHDLARFLAPLALDSAGYCLGQVSTADVRVAAQAAVTATDVSSIDLTGMQALYFLRWALDYWQQPTTFTYTELLASVVASHDAALRWLHPQLREIATEVDTTTLAAYLRLVLQALQPPKAVAIALTICRDGSSVLLTALFLLRGTVPIALAPFAYAQWPALVELRTLWREGSADCDSLDWILLRSPLLGVWTNVKAGVYCLECGAQAARAVAATSAAATVALKLRSLVAAVGKARAEGWSAHWDTVTDSVFSIYAARESAAHVWTYVWQRVCHQHQ
ncbi:hypothetical protein SDRG_08813 [Saprolegnia diclina VS20]|uniref:Uncharacterized protein n=1 Tax=Saprolegnia diclina (strain VS20) TaxID=1156394 RepID=T0QIY6_SAPDV|nr:hypothetical protein SDRG_08813 [Saprolegnia diclina VS20]EQC33710.1 hypothetical protein SDRG_08813 [Saprolegnia diclina VS20]|eukprot:XP_008612933.1 hypothetical protein SDRG_08813 [Saprolegnia diclina VS20]